jgi:hypothetical protein
MAFCFELPFWGNARKRTHTKKRRVCGWVWGIINARVVGSVRSVDFFLPAPRQELDGLKGCRRKKEETKKRRTYLPTFFEIF